MRRPNFARQLLIAAFAPLCFAPAAAQQLGGEERRIVIALDQSDTSWAAEGKSQRRMSLRMAHAAIVHRLRVDLVDAQGEVITAGADWDVTVFSAALGGVMATLNQAHPELRVPRPYGLRLDAADSLTVQMDVRAFGAGDVSLRAVIDYELPEATASRLPVLALTSSRAVLNTTKNSAKATTEDAWTWQPTVQGRLVAVSSEAVARADEIVLEDVATGAVLWRTRTQRPLSGAAGYQRQEQIRPGITLEEGRSYRLRTIYAANEAPSAAERALAPLAVMRPNSAGNQ